jgi:hypothetical protein
MAATDGERISVSREALRADLLDLELRLRDALSLKADASLVIGIQTEVARQAALLTAVDAKVKEIDHYGSSEMRTLKERVRNVEGTLVTEDQVRDAVRDSVIEGRSAGSHKAMWIGALVAAVALIGNFVFAAIQQVTGG